MSEFVCLSLLSVCLPLAPSLSVKVPLISSCVSCLSVSAASGPAALEEVIYSELCSRDLSESLSPGRRVRSNYPAHIRPSSLCTREREAPLPPTAQLITNLDSPPIKDAEAGTFAPLA